MQSNPKKEGKLTAEEKAMVRNLTLVIAWDTERRGPLAVRVAADLRQARGIAEDFQKEYGWSPRISFLKEVDAYITPSHPDAPNYAEQFLDEDGWEAEWIQEREDAMGAQREEERERRRGW